MTEIVKNDQVTYTKKIDGYNESHGFLANQELTVTVNLTEYRELLKELEEKIETLKSMFVNNDD